MASVICLSFPTLSELPIWETRGIVCCTFLHVVLVEPLYYCVHRLSHVSVFFKRYHWLHHSSIVPHPFAGKENTYCKIKHCLLNGWYSIFAILFGAAGHSSFLEHLILCVIVGIPLLGTTLIGYGSISMFYSYIMVFDFLRCLGHSNIEVIPHQIFDILPPLKYLIYTPT